MKTLELNQLKNYLGTGLQMYGGSQISTLKGLEATDEKEFTLFLNDVVRDLEGSSLEHSPVCYPLSMLTEEIEHPVTGEKFVPLKELHKIYTIRGFERGKPYSIIYKDRVISENLFKSKHGNGSESYIEFIESYTNADDVQKSFRYDHNLRRFLVRNDTEKKPLGVGYQYDLFQKLFEWHFWIFDQEDFGTLVIDKSKM